MKYLSQEVIKNKRVILRCDFNVPIKDEIIIDNSKIINSLKTIKHLLDNNNQVFILSHFGRVKNEDDIEKNSLRYVYYELKKHISDIAFAPDNENVSEETIKHNKCILIENTRFTDINASRESANDPILSAYWASLGDIFVVDAFASLHRCHSSTCGIARFLPTYFGFLVEEEMNYLTNIYENKEHPFLVIMGGAKPDEKINVIKSLLEKCDKLLLTGGILNSFLKAKGINIGKSVSSNDSTLTQEMLDIINSYSDKLIFSKKIVVKNIKNEVKNINQVTDYDTILDNIVTCSDEIRNAKLIFMNGTCGKYEEEEYSIGTKKLLEMLKTSSAKKIAGGGDAVAAIKKFGYNNDFDYLSTGGGAALEFLATGSLKAIDYINNCNF